MYSYLQEPCPHNLEFRRKGKGQTVERDGGAEAEAFQD